ncbi:MAG: hypothetical protein AAFO62_01600, partial [Pseudomonadota bacterium]
MELWLLIATATAMALSGFIRRDALFEWPTVAGLLCIAFFVPQALHIDRSPVGATHAAWVTWLYISLCLVLGWIGFVWGKRRGVLAGVSRFERPSNSNWILVCSDEEKYGGT